MKKIVISAAIAIQLLLSSCSKSDTASIPKAVKDIYVAGYEFNNLTPSTAMYWKNETAVGLTDGSKNAFAAAIAVSGSDVYVAGYEFSGAHNVAKYWKNGTAVGLTD